LIKGSELLFERYLCIVPYFINKGNVFGTTLKGLNNLYQIIVSYGCSKIVISTARYLGWDPLEFYEYKNYANVKEWYERLFDITNITDIPIIIDSEYIDCNILQDYPGRDISIYRVPLENHIHYVIYSNGYILKSTL